MSLHLRVVLLHQDCFERTWLVEHAVSGLRHMWELTSRAHYSLVIQVCLGRKHRWVVWSEGLKRDLRLQVRRELAQRRCRIQRLRNYWLVSLIKTLLIFQPILEPFEWRRPAVFHFSAPIWIGRNSLQFILLLWIGSDYQFTILRVAHSLHRTGISHPPINKGLLHAYLSINKTL